MKLASLRPGMSTAVLREATIRHVEVTDETITAHLADGRVISVPLAWSWRLSDATPAQRAKWELIGDGSGVHWPDIDEDISAEGMLGGVPARRPKAVDPKATRPANKRLQPAARGRAAKRRG
ncbi:MAG: DUF2442 domain-containing protein [Vicinamibacterales bacterium]